ncbi:MAG: hypothetical protein GDA52_08970 [Rhodobacteraceae bacterium]|nr:hypothetical protein [Paracoccaceae bacterium]
MTRCGITRFEERDIDLLLAEELAVNRAFARWLLSFDPTAPKVTLPAATSNISVHQDGSEADVVADFARIDGGKHRVFIEDKINAPLMDEQLERYVRRAQGDIRMERYTSASIFLVAPANYQVPLPDGVRRITFEQIAAAFPQHLPDARGQWRGDLFLRARPVGSASARDAQVKQDDPYIAEWWNAVYAKLENRHPSYFVHRTQYPRSTYFAPGRTDQPNSIRVDFKGHRGEVDLAFKEWTRANLEVKLKDLPPPPGVVIGNPPSKQSKGSAALRISGMEKVLISDGFDVIDGPMMALYDATRSLLDYWSDHMRHLTK